MDFYDAYHFLKSHPMFNGRFWEALDIDVVKVNPDTNSIDDDKHKKYNKPKELAAVVNGAFGQ